MQKISGLILDVYDDVDASVLRTIWPDESSLPELVKHAEAVTPDLDSKLPDDMFALVLQEGDVTLRKYACIDPGNTALSVEYFMRTKDQLPDYAQKTAAANLSTACGWYDIPVPAALEKVAIGVGTALNAAFLAPDQAKSVKRGLAQVKPMGSTIITPKQRKRMGGM